MSESTWSPTPAIDNLATLSKQIAGYAGMPDDTEALETAAAGLRRAVDRLNTRKWNWSLNYEDVIFIADQGEYDLPSQMKAPRKLVLIDTDGLEVGILNYLPWPEFVDRLVGCATTDPTHYSMSNTHEFGLVTLNGTPTADWIAKYPSCRIWYYRRLGYAVDPEDVLECPSEVALFVQAWAEGFTADRYAQQKAGPAYQRAMDAWREIVKDDNDTMTDWER